MENFEITVDDLLAIDGGNELVIGDESKDNPAIPEFVPDITNTGSEEEEEKEEDKVPAVEPEKKVEEIKEEPKEAEEKTQPDFYLNVSKKLLSDSKWRDVEITVDEKVVKLSEATEMDEEMFFQIYEAQEEAKKEDIDSNYVSVENVDENNKRLINIIKNGGDLTEIFQNPAQLRKPFEGWNLEDEKNQEKIVYWHLTQKQKLPAEDAEELVKKYKKDLTIDAKTQTIVKFHQESYDKGLAETEKKVIEARQAEETAIKDYRKNLSTIYKTEGMVDSLSRRLIDAATKKDENGTLVIDAKYEELMQDPQKAKDLIFFILEPENYLKAKGATIKKNEQVDLMRKVSIIRQNSGKTTTKKEDDIPQSESVFDQIVLE